MSDDEAEEAENDEDAPQHFPSHEFWGPALSRTFYGGRLVQTDEHAGRSVPFAGHRVFGIGNRVVSRALNPNITYNKDGSDTYRFVKTRFVSGDSGGGKRSKLG